MLSMLWGCAVTWSCSVRKIFTGSAHTLHPRGESRQRSCAETTGLSLSDRLVPIILVSMKEEINGAPALDKPALTVPLKVPSAYLRSENTLSDSDHGFIRYR